MALLFDIAALSSADSLDGIKRSTKTNAQTERIRVLSEALQIVTNPGMRVQIESLLQQELDRIDETRRSQPKPLSRPQTIGLISLIVVATAVLILIAVHA